MKRLLVVASVLWLLDSHAAGAAAFQWATAPDGDSPPLQVAIWYPSNSLATLTTIGPFDMNVAMNGAVNAGHHPLIVMSHGTGGMALNAYDTAEALANAGFVVVAVTHTGDNYRDQSMAFTRQNFVDRPRHITRVIDYMLGAWSAHAAIDPDRIGIFGHSAGGATALIAIGGIADMSKVVTYCQENPQDWGCAEARRRGSPASDFISTPIAAVDTRIKAAVLVAPAVAAAFQPNGLATAKVPVQLWIGAKDDYVSDAARVRTLLPTPPDYHLVANGGHFAYLAPCGELLARSAPEICVDPKGFDRTAFLRDFHHSVIAFYRQRLK
jgi:predicted dienelactone hydrolase